MFNTIIGVIILILIFVLTALADLSKGRFTKMRREEDSIEDRIQKLTSSLKEAVNVLREIETEISTRSTLVEKLQQDITIYEKISKLKSSEVEAVAQLLRGELKKKEKNLFGKALLLILFFIY